MTNRFLLVDAGNSFIKWAVDDGSTLSHNASAPIDSLDLSTSWVQLPAPEAVCVANVASDEVRNAISDYCSRIWHRRVQFIESQSQQLGVINGYTDPAQLGCDRWAALIGAWGLHKVPLAVVDCGTAVTVDVINANGEFVGGVIFPGMDLMRHSLLNHTQFINEIESPLQNVFGRSTGECVRAGVEFAVVGGLERVLREFTNEMGNELKVLLTGGQAGRVQQWLNHPVDLIPDLVLQGLARIIRSSNQAAVETGE